MCLFFKLYSLSKIQANTIRTNTHTHTHEYFTTLLLGGLLDPYCPLAHLASLCLSAAQLPEE